MSYLALAEKIIAEKGLSSPRGASHPVPLRLESPTAARRQPDLAPDVSAWPPSTFSRWVARAVALEAAGLPADDADRRAADEIAAESKAGPAEPWVWFSGGAGPFRLAGDEPPTANHPELVARALGALTAMNRSYPRDDAACQRAAERLEAALAELRQVGVRAWLAS